MLYLQQTVGNQVLTRMLAGKNGRKVTTKPGSQTSAVQRGLFGDEYMSVQDVIDERDPDEIKDLSNLQLRGATRLQRIQLIELILNNVWVGPSDESEIERIWNSFPKDKLAEAYRMYKDTWDRSLDAGAELDDIDLIEDIKRDFERDVKATAKHYLVANEKHVLGQMKAIGLSPGMCMIISEENVRNLQSLQAAAAKVVSAQEAIERLNKIPVGYNTRKEYDVVDMPGGGWRAIDLGEVTETAYFNPNQEPDSPPKGDEAMPMASWSETKSHYDALKGVIGGFANTYPAIYAMIRDGNTAEFAKSDSPEKAQAMVGGAMESLYNKIIEVKSKLGGDLDYRDLKPIHAQLFGGMKALGGSGINWSESLNKWAAEDLISDYESSEFWQSLILGGIAAVAFIVAELATAGTATFFIAAGVGLGAGTLQAGISWEKYLDLSQAAEANVKDDLVLVSEAQAKAALISAVLDTAFMFLDIYGVGKAYRAGVPIIREAAEAGVKKAALEGLKDLGGMGAEEAAPLVTRSITELGVEETMRRSGKTADELIAIVGKETEAGKRLTAFKEAAAAGIGEATDLMATLPNLAKQIAEGKITREAADQLAVKAIEKYGPKQALEIAGGWKKLASTLGEGSKAGDNLIAWRKQLVDDLEKYVREELGGELKRTGTLDKFTSDLDISLLGPNAAANRDKALSFLAGRSGTTPDNLGKLLYTDLFTDPRRMHLLDELPEGIRKAIAKEAATYERDLIWNQRLYQALEAGEESLAIEIRDQMKALGVKEVKFTPMDKLDIHTLNNEIDGLHKKFADALASRDTAAQEKLAREIGEKQALINAAEGGGYFSGGGVRKFVSEREEFAGFTKAELAEEARRLLPEQKFTAVLDQLPKLDEVANKLLNALSPDDVAAALKGIGKYGERLTEMAGDLAPGRIPGLTSFDEMAETFSKLLESARKPAAEAGSLSRELAGNADAVVQKAFKALNDLERSSVTILSLLQRRASVEEASSALAKIQFMTKAHVKFLRAKDAVNLQAKEGARLVSNLTKESAGSTE